MGPFFVVDLRGYAPQITDHYGSSPARLVGPFHHFMMTLLAMYKSIHNSAGDEDVVLDNYINGSMVTLNDAAQQHLHVVMQSMMGLLTRLGMVYGEIHPGLIRNLVFDQESWTLLIEFGGENDQA